MTDHPGRYPPAQVYHPPELPAYYKNVHDLRPIVGVPSDDEVIGIHAVVHAANRVSGVPGMHDPYLFMKLADHLFSVQLAKYRSKYSSTSSNDATYTPPALPAHVSINLGAISGTPSDEEMIKVQHAVRAYQQFSGVSSMFDPHVNMELSQHLFNIQMARCMRLDCGTQATTKSGDTTQPVEQPANTVEGVAASMNNAGTCGNSVEVHQTSQSALGANVSELMERSNRLAERFNVLLERSNELAERSTQPGNNSNPIMELFKQALEEFIQIAERTDPPTEQPDLRAARLNDLFGLFNQMARQFNQPTQQTDQLTERFHQLVERSNQLVELLCQPVRQSNQLLEQSNQHVSQLSHAIQRSNQLAERLNQILADFHPIRRSNELSEQANQLAAQLGQSSKRSNQLAEQTNKHTERLGDVMENMNRVLTGIQHAIVRGNTMSG